MEAPQVAEFGHRGPRDGALEAPSGLKRLAHRREASGVPLVAECVCETLPACGRFGDGLDVFLHDHVRRRSGAAPRTAPAQVGRAPRGSPRRADVVPQHEGLEPHRGGRQIPQGLFPRPAQSAEGGIVDGGNRHRGEVPGAHQPGQWPGITPVGVDPVARLCGHQGGGDDPAAVAVFPQGAREPGAAGTSCVDEDALRTLRLQRPKPLRTLALPGPARAEGDTLCPMVLGDRGDRDGRLVDIQADRKRARLLQG
jgi:hypothetical protein